MTETLPKKLLKVSVPQRFSATNDNLQKITPRTGIAFGKVFNKSIIIKTIQTKLLFLRKVESWVENLVTLHVSYKLSYHNHNYYNLTLLADFILFLDIIIVKL